MKMKLKELLDVCMYGVELHSSKDGSLVASSRATLEKYGEVEVMQVIPRVKLGHKGCSAQPYLYVFGSSVDIYNIKQGGQPF